IAAARHRPDACRPATRWFAERRVALDRAASLTIPTGAAAGHEARQAAGRLRGAGHHGVLALGPQRFVLDRRIRHRVYAAHVVAVAGGGGTIALPVRHRANGSDLSGIIRLLATGWARPVVALIRHRWPWERRDQPQKPAQDENPADRIS